MVSGRDPSLPLVSGPRISHAPARLLRFAQPQITCSASRSRRSEVRNFHWRAVKDDPREEFRDTPDTDAVLLLRPFVKI